MSKIILKTILKFTVKGFQNRCSLFLVLVKILAAAFCTWCDFAIDVLGRPARRALQSSNLLETNKCLCV